MKPILAVAIVTVATAGVFTVGYSLGYARAMKWAKEKFESLTRAVDEASRR